MKKRLGGDIPGKADPNWLKGFSVPYNAITSHSAVKTGVEEEGRFLVSKGAAVQRLAGRWSVCGR